MEHRVEYKQLKDLCDPNRGITYGIVKVGDYVPGGVPVIRGGDIRDGRIVFDDNKRVTTEVSQKFKRTILQGGEILINLIAEPGHTAIVPLRLAGSNVSRDVAVIPLNDQVNHKYVDYFLKSSIAVRWLSSRLQGSVTQKINLGTLSEIPIPLPSLPEQKGIAATLSCLDDMIGLNNRTNQILEEIAQAIFLQWFVDFDFPNEDGEPYKCSSGEMVYSELGEIPKGWRVGSLLDIADYLNGLAMQKYRPNENEKGYPVLKIKELRQGMTDSSSEMCSENINPNYIVNDGDLIFSWSGSLMVDFWCGGKCGLNQHLFKVTSGKYDKWYYYFWTNYHLQKFIGIAKDKATTMGHIKRGDLEKSQVLIMDDTNYRKLDSICKPIIETIIANRVENRKLNLVRDTLLPKLMSGEIRVPVEEVC